MLFYGKTEKLLLKQSMLSTSEAEPRKTEKIAAIFDELN